MSFNAFFYEPGREIHSADGHTYIKRVTGLRITAVNIVIDLRRPVWEVVVNTQPLATFFRREDARMLIREKKFQVSRYGREDVL